MAKLLGHEIVTQAEFDDFVAGDFKKHELEMLMLRTEIVSLQSINKKLQHFIITSGLSMVLSAVAIILVLTTK
jgi:hypothetical protein